MSTAATATSIRERSTSPEAADDTFHLQDVEVETVRRAAAERNLLFDPEKRTYSRTELARFGVVREGYSRDELRARGVFPRVVSSLDGATDLAKNSLPLETPYGSGIRKWQLPIDMLPIQVAKTVFPPGSVVTRHVHPPNTEEDPGGGLRIVVSGSISYDGRSYGPGDWFFVPNGTPYQFTTDSDQETIVFYTYRFFGVTEGNRFSHPHDVQGPSVRGLV